MALLVPADFAGLITNERLIELTTADKNAEEVVELGIEAPEVAATIAEVADHVWSTEMWGPLARVAAKPDELGPGPTKETLKRLVRYHLYMRTPSALLADNGREHPIVTDYKLTLLRVEAIGLRKYVLPSDLVAIAAPCATVSRGRSVCCPPELEII